jgi:SHS2 domain-containing protein
LGTRFWAWLPPGSPIEITLSFFISPKKLIAQLAENCKLNRFPHDFLEQKTENMKNRRPAYYPLSHTADAAWRIRGASLPDIFANAAAALTATLTDRRYVRPRETREVAIEAPDREALLVDWLNRLLYLFDTEGFLARDVIIEFLSEQRLNARVRGEIYDPDRHVQKTAVKAATYHHLEIIPANGGWQATVILDL